MGFMTGKRVLIVGVASKLSIASGIAAAMHREGAELAFSYQSEKLQKRAARVGFGKRRLAWDDAVSPRVRIRRHRAHQAAAREGRRDQPASGGRTDRDDAGAGRSPSRRRCDRSAPRTA